MKGRLFIFGALALLLAGILFMVWDMFLNKPDSSPNPYEYDIKSLRAGDTAAIAYEELQSFSPGMNTLHGISVDRNDHIYICGENRIEEYDLTGKLLNKFEVNGVAGCIHVDSAGKIYAGIQDHIEVFDHNGKVLMKWKSCGSNAMITSIGVSDKQVFVADAGNKVVYQYDNMGTLLRKIGEKDPVRNIPGFVIPSPYFDLGIGIKGELWVVNPGRHRFEQYSNEGDLVSSWGLSSMTMEGFCGCCNPANFAILSDGSFVTSEKGIERIKIYSPEGDFNYVVAGPDSFIEGTRGLDLAVDSKNRIVVLDPEKKKVRFFTLKSGSAKQIN
jgi:sugar lactone lactonase YvrE